MISLYKIVIFTIVLTTIFAIILSISVFGFGVSPYKFIWLLPSVYLINLFAFTSMLQSRFGVITVWSAVVLLFIQTVLFPLSAVAIGEGFTGRRHIGLADDTISEAILVIAFGNLFFGFFAWAAHSAIMQKMNKREHGNGALVLKGSRIVYHSFILLAICLFLAVGLPNNLLSLFLKTKEVVDDPGSFLLLVRQVSWAGIALAYVIILEKSARKYHLKGNNRYFIMAVLASVLITGVIYGDRRSMQLFTGLLAVFLLIRQFPNKKIVIVNVIGGAMVFTVLSLTYFRFEQQGALQATRFSFSSFDLMKQMFAESLQIYYGGVDSVALGIQFSRAQNLALSDMFFDFGRTIFGLNFLLKGESLLLSQQYNAFIYDGAFLNGQLLFAVSYGFALFGFLGAPIFLTINFTYALVLEIWLRSTRSIEMQFLLGFCLLRVATNQLVNTPTINSVVTLQFMTLGLVIFFAKLLKEIDRPYLVRNGFYGFNRK